LVEGAEMRDRPRRRDEPQPRLVGRVRHGEVDQQREEPGQRVERGGQPQPPCQQPAARDGDHRPEPRREPAVLLEQRVQADRAGDRRQPRHDRHADSHEPSLTKYSPVRAARDQTPGRSASDRMVTTRQPAARSTPAAVSAGTRAPAAAPARPSARPVAAAARRPAAPVPSTRTATPVPAPRRAAATERASSAVRTPNTAMTSPSASCAEPVRPRSAATPAVSEGSFDLRVIASLSSSSPSNPPSADAAGSVSPASVT